MNPDANLIAGWAGMLCGAVSGATLGLFFFDESWLGGYGAWRRRMVRLGHIAFFGLGFLNILYALSAHALGLQTGLAAPSALLLAGAVLMPLVCFLSAFRPSFRRLFFLPVVSIFGGSALFLLKLLKT